jgi:hypothetical protein
MRADPHASAAVPEAMWTGVPPAKSRPPSCADHPFGFQVQQAIGSYISVDHISMKMMQGSIRPRSATAPVARATVIAENMPWYTANNKSGTFEEPTEGCANTSLKPKFVKSPMKELAVCEKVKE